MVASLDAQTLHLIQACGVLFALVGLGLLIYRAVRRGPGREEEQLAEFLGLKFRFSSADVVVFLTGAVFVLVPLFVGVSSPVPERPPPLAPQGGVGSADRVPGGEVEPNDYVTEANAVEFGAVYAGAIDRDDKDFFAFEVGPGAQDLRLILRRVQGTGGLAVSVSILRGRNLASASFGMCLARGSRLVSLEVMFFASLPTGTCVMRWARLINVEC